MLCCISNSEGDEGAKMSGTMVLREGGGGECCKEIKEWQQNAEIGPDESASGYVQPGFDPNLTKVDLRRLVGLGQVCSKIIVFIRFQI